MAIRIAIDLKLFNLIAEKPYTLAELTKATGADSKLLKRIIRAVTATGNLRQIEVDKWGSTPFTHVLASLVIQDSLIVHFDGRLKIYEEFPQWLKQHEYKTSWVSDDDNIAKQIYGMDIWSYYEKNPEVGSQFDSAMAFAESFPPSMVPPYPFVNGFDGINTDPDAVTFVDVGGGRGQAIKSIKRAYNDIPGRFILQDVPSTIKRLDASELKTEGFEAMSHNFFDPQPIKNAKYYHLRRVFHDWNDEQCLKILKATRSAMDPTYSRLLIGDFVLPDMSSGPFETGMGMCSSAYLLLPVSDVVVDLVMMTSVDGTERSEGEWKELLQQGGFEIEKIWRPESVTNCTIEAKAV